MTPSARRGASGRVFLGERTGATGALVSPIECSSNSPDSWSADGPEPEGWICDKSLPGHPLRQPAGATLHVDRRDARVDAQLSIRARKVSGDGSFRHAEPLADL